MVKQEDREWDAAGWKRVGEYVVARRTHLRWKQAELVRRSKINPTTLRGIEKGKHSNYEPVTLIALCDALHWERNSIQLILDGLEPAIAETTLLREDVTDDVLRRLDLAEARIAELQRESLRGRGIEPPGPSNH